MQYTIEKILNGETVVDYYQKALKKWHEILSSNQNVIEILLTGKHPRGCKL